MEKKESSIKKKVSREAKKVVKNVKEHGKDVIEKSAKKSAELAEKKVGMISGAQIAGVLIILIVALVMYGLFRFVSSLGGNKYPDYALVYQNADGNLMLSNSGKGKPEKLSSNSNIDRVIYANTSDRYILYVKNSSLYLYDIKRKDTDNKLSSEIEDYMFTDNDKYIVMLDANDNLYSYDFKDKGKLDSNVSSIKTLNDQFVIYTKEDSLYVKGLNPDKDDKVKISKNFGSSVTLSKDGKKVLYIDSEYNLRYYMIKNGKTEKIASKVYEYYADEDCNKVYYMTSDGENKLYYYNGKEAVKLATKIYAISDVNVEEQQVVYAKESQGKYELYYQKKAKDAVLLDKKLSSMKYVKIFKGKEIYYINDDKDVKYVKISGSKLGHVKTIAEDVEDSLREYKKGFVFVADVDKNSNGTLYFASSGKAKKVDTDVYSANIKVSTNGKRIFYLKDYSSNSGTLCSSTGGKGKQIDVDVYRYQYISDKLIYYIKDYSATNREGELYFSKGSKGKKIADDVRAMASNQNIYEVS